MSGGATALRRRLGMAVLAVAALLHAPHGSAAEPLERPYNPAVGSRWIIQSETEARDVRPDGPRASLIRMRAELTIEAKLPDGFRISYVNRGTTTEGNDPSVAMLRSAVKALENVTIHATTDVSGKPIRVDNIDEAKAAMRAMKDGLFEPFRDKPHLVTLLNQMIGGLIEVDASQAASAYIDELPALARAQSTGMKPGDIRRSSNTAENPLGGGALKSNAAFEMTGIDPTTGRLTFVNTTSYDAGSMKEFMQSMTKKLLAASGDNARPAEVDAVIRSMKLSLDERAVFEVEDGMTRRISEKSVTTVSAMGHTLSRTETRVVTVTPAP